MPSENPPEKKDAPPASTPLPHVAEGDLARSLGLSRDDLKKMRAELVEGVDWTGGAGKPVVITASGREKLQARLGATAPVVTSQPADRTLALVVVKKGGDRLLLARHEATGAVYRVQVKRAEHFLPGMPLRPCDPHPEFADVAFYRGPYPRRRGVLPV